MTKEITLGDIIINEGREDTDASQTGGLRLLQQHISSESSLGASLVDESGVKIAAQASALDMPAIGGRDAVLFVDPAISDLKSVISNVKAGTDVVMLDPTRDAATQISETLNGHQGVSSVHVASAHGSNHAIVSDPDSQSDLSLFDSTPTVSKQGEFTVSSWNAQQDGFASQHDGSVATAAVAAAPQVASWVLDEQTEKVHAATTESGVGHNHPDGGASGPTILFPSYTAYPNIGDDSSYHGGNN